MFVLMTTRNTGLSLEEYYSFMFFFVIIKALIFWMTNPGQPVLDVEQYRLGAFPYQAVTGIVIGLSATSLLFFIGTYTPIADPVGEFLTQSVFVAFVETLLMVVLVRTFFMNLPVAFHLGRDKRKGRVWFDWVEVPLGIVLWPILFAMLHAAVREPWLSGQFTLESLVAFAWGAGWAVLFYMLWYLREAGGWYSLAFGAVTVWVAHVTANLVILTYPARAGPFEFFPMAMEASPMGLPDWVLWATFMGLSISAYYSASACLSSWFAQRRRSSP